VSSQIERTFGIWHFESLSHLINIETGKEEISEYLLSYAAASTLSLSLSLSLFLSLSLLLLLALVQ
jgi:hypothetical protein